MATLKNYEGVTFTSAKSFSKEVQSVLTGITGRNQQLQQLLIVATEEATKANNLTWLSALTRQVEATKGIATKRIVKYILDVLLCGTARWQDKQGLDGQYVKASKDVTLRYNVNPTTTWMDYEKAERAKDVKPFDEMITALVKRSLEGDDKHNKLSASQVLDSVLKAGITAQELFEMLAEQDAA